MRRFNAILALVTACIFLPSVAIADPKIEDTPLADSGKLAGYNISPHGVHTAVLLNKGTRFIVSIDGTDGPKIDGILMPDGTPYPPGVDHTLSRPIPVVFSDDGAHSAYFAKAGDEFFLISDGKEIYRSKYNSGLSFFVPLTVTGKHVFFGGASPTGHYTIVADGTPGPDSHLQPQLTISPDGNHFAYVGTLADGHDTKYGVVDGKQVNYFGEDLQFSAKGHLFAVKHGQGAMTLNIDNKDVMKAGNIQHVWISPHGGMFAALINPQPAAPFLLTVNTKPVPASQGATITKVYFSPDDKHFAALVSGSPQYMILDGKKGDPYQQIPDNNTMNLPGQNSRAWANGVAIGTEMTNETNPSPTPSFTADSSRFLYVAMNGNKFVLVSNTDESDPLSFPFAPILSPDGNRYAYVVNAAGKPPAVVIDDKTIKLAEAHPNTGADIVFSPDGNHYLAFSGGTGVLYIDGKYHPDIIPNGLATYSPDSQHFLLLGHDPKKDTPILYLDGKPLVTGPDDSHIFRPTFSADSKHLFWVGFRASTTTDDHDNGVLWVDAKPTKIQFNQADLMHPIAWEAAPDGSLTFIARTAEDLHRYHVIPDPNTSLNAISSASK